MIAAPGQSAVVLGLRARICARAWAAMNQQLRRAAAYLTQKLTFEPRVLGTCLKKLIVALVDAFGFFAMVSFLPS